MTPAPTMAEEEASSPEPTPSWVDRMLMVPLSDSTSMIPTTQKSSSSYDRNTSGDGVSSDISSSGATDQPLEFNIASLNVLAESYLTPRSHPGLPKSYATVAFDPIKRRKLLLDTLERFCGPSSSSSRSGENHVNDKKWDILAIQELDLLQPDDPILPAFESWGYEVVRTPGDHRKDCCAIAFDKSKFSLVEYEVVTFDDLATLKNNNITSDDGKENGNVIGRNDAAKGAAAPLIYKKRGPNKSKTPPSELSGMVRSFLRRNCAVLAHLKSIATNESLVVTSVHLYWHPGYEYVKLCQSKYLLDRVAAFASIKNKDTNATTSSAAKATTKDNDSNGRIPTIICGDMNSKPGSIVHQLFVEPHVDARAVAPWRYFWDQDGEENYTEEEEEKKEEEVDKKEIVNVSEREKDRRDGQDPIGAGNLNSLAVVGGDAPETKVEGGYMMSGMAGGGASEAKVEGGYMMSGMVGGDASETKEEGGYMMSGFSMDFTMYCSTIEPNNEANGDENNNSGIKSEVGEANNPEKVGQEKGYLTKHPIKHPALSSISLSEVDEDISSNYDELKATFTSKGAITHITPQDYQHSTPPPPVKYMLDYTLTKFAKWLRILGIDAVLETIEEEHERTHGGNIAMFDRCKKERRTLITSSYKLLLRRECPPGAYLLDSKSNSDLLEKALPTLLCTHGLELSPRTFLTRCVVCNGHINRVTADEEKWCVFVDHGAPDLVGRQDMEVFRCDGCGQGYWWDDRPSSSASRVFAQATKLLKTCLRGGVGLKDEHNPDEKKRKETMGAFDFVDVKKERQSGDATSKKTTQELAVIEWLREKKLSNPFHLRSVNAAQRGDNARGDLPFTNVTKEFVGCLDYVYFEHEQFDQTYKLKVPTSFREMNPSGDGQGHLIPSDIWPSDHIAVGARLRLKQQTKTNGKNKREVPKANASTERTTDIKEAKASNDPDRPVPHPDTCACGCLPNILSLHDMAVLRKKYRERKKAEAAEAAKLIN